MDNMYGCAGCSGCSHDFDEGLNAGSRFETAGAPHVNEHGPPILRGQPRDFYELVSCRTRCVLESNTDTQRSRIELGTQQSQDSV